MTVRFAIICAMKRAPDMTINRPTNVSIALDDPENEEDLEFLGRGNSM